MINVVNVIHILSPLKKGKRKKRCLCGKTQGFHSSVSESPWQARKCLVPLGELMWRFHLWCLQYLPGGCNVAGSSDIQCMKEEGTQVSWGKEVDACECAQGQGAAVGQVEKRVLVFWHWWA